MRLHWRFFEGSFSAPSKPPFQSPCSKLSQQMFLFSRNFARSLCFSPHTPLICFEKKEKSEDCFEQNVFFFEGTNSNEKTKAARP